MGVSGPSLLIESTNSMIHWKVYMLYNVYICTCRTFSEISNPAELQRRCHELCMSLSKDVQTEGVMVSGCAKDSAVIAV